MGYLEMGSPIRYHFTKYQLSFKEISEELFKKISEELFNALSSSKSTHGLLGRLKVTPSITIIRFISIIASISIMILNIKSLSCFGNLLFKIWIVFSKFESLSYNPKREFGLLKVPMKECLRRKLLEWNQKNLKLEKDRNTFNVKEKLLLSWKHVSYTLESFKV